MWTMDPAGLYRLMICKRDSIVRGSLEGLAFSSNIANFLAHVARCAIFALKARRFLHSTRDGGGHTEEQNILLYDTVMQIWSISGADDVPPARRCGTYAPLSAKNLACKSILCRFEIAAPCGGGATSFHPRKNLRRTQINEARFSDLGWV